MKASINYLPHEIVSDWLFLILNIMEKKEFEYIIWLYEQELECAYNGEHAWGAAFSDSREKFMELVVRDEDE